MAQDKVAEIINFKGGAGAPAGAPAPDENAPALAGAEHAGAFLAAAREAAGLSVDEVSEAIKVKASHIAAIEVMRADLLPALPYASGFVKSYARYLGLDAEAVAGRFRAEIADVQKAAAAPDEAAQGAPYAAPASYAAPSPVSAAGEGARLATVFALLAVLLFVMWVGFQVLSGSGDEPATGPNVVVSAPSAATRPSLLVPAPTARPQEQPATQAQDGAAAEADPSTEGSVEDAAPAAPLPEEEGAAAETPEASGEPVEETAQETPQVTEATPAGEAPPAPTLASETAAPEAQADQTAQPTETQSLSQPPPQTRPLPRRPRPALPVVEEASLSRSVPPAYPERCARGAKDVESVTVMFDVSAAGRAVNARIVTSTDSCFNDQALRALAQWRFEPRTVDGAASLETGKSATLNFRK